VTATGEPLLRVRDVSVRFDGIVALDGVSFDVRRGDICGLIGPNGAGKTTLLNCLSRLYQVESGSIELDGRPLLAAPRHHIARLGVGRTFQNLALFGSMTVRDNILTGGHAGSRGGFVANALRLPLVAREERRLQDRANELIELLDLTAVAGTPVAALPFVARKKVELARALAGQPRLLLLDEPAGGLEHEEVERLRGLIGALRERLDLTILLVEHHLGLVMRLSDRIVALDFGRTLAEDTPDEMRTHPEVVRAYLGATA
jgi:branched-chain amino acid transport system ATP-binding protein